MTSSIIESVVGKVCKVMTIQLMNFVGWFAYFAIQRWRHLWVPIQRWRHLWVVRTHGSNQSHKKAPCTVARRQPLSNTLNGISPEFGHCIRRMPVTNWAFMGYFINDPEINGDVQWSTILYWMQCMLLLAWNKFSNRCATLLISFSSYSFRWQREREIERERERVCVEVKERGALHGNNLISYSKPTVGKR